MGARGLVVGFDGFDLAVVEELGAERLPHLYDLMRRGAHGALESVWPPATLPNWTTFLTGLDPGRHGVFDFTTRHGYAVRFTGGTARRAPTVFQTLDEAGLRCACLSFPATWPPERLRRGIFVSGWDAPVAFEADRSFMWPPSLYEETTARFGKPTFDDVDEFHADDPGWVDRLPDALSERIAKKTRWARWLLEREEWDVFATYFGESDTASHYLWSLHDPGSPRRPARVTPTQAQGLCRVYQSLDRALGALVDASGRDVEVTVLSDHGSGGSSDKVLYVNRLLAEHGLLRFKPRGRPIGARLKELGLRRLHPRLRERLFRLGGAWLPSRLESRVRFGGIDMANTTAFSDELNYFPGVHLNVRGREPSGILAPEQMREAIVRVRAALRGARDPWTGAPVIRDVIPREELYEGPFVDRAPDLLLDLHLDRGYSYNLMPSQASKGASFRKLAPTEYLGKKGRSLPGSHRAHGFMTIAGPSVQPTGRIDAHIADLTATMLHRLELSVPPSFKGRVLWQALQNDETRRREPLPETTHVRSRRGARRGVVEARLRALGYID